MSYIDHMNDIKYDGGPSQIDRIRAFLSGLGYEGSTEKMVDQLAADAVARKTERDETRALLMNPLGNTAPLVEALLRERDQLDLRWALTMKELATKTKQFDDALALTNLAAARGETLLSERDQARAIASRLRTKLDSAEFERDASKARVVVIEKERDQARSELAAGTLLMHEHMRQRDEAKAEIARLSTCLDEQRKNWRTEVADLQSGIVAYRKGRSFMAGGDESALLAWEHKNGHLVGDIL